MVTKVPRKSADILQHSDIEDSNKDKEDESIKKGPSI